jgi:hypothetical protein
MRQFEQHSAHTATFEGLDEAAAEAVDSAFTAVTAYNHRPAVDISRTSPTSGLRR